MTNPNSSLSELSEEQEGLTSDDLIILEPKPNGLEYLRESDKLAAVDTSSSKGSLLTTEKVDIEHGSFLSPVAQQDATPTLVDGPLYGWVVVFACTLCLMISMGNSSAFGVYQHYYLTERFQGTATSFQITWIGTLTMLTMDVFGTFAGSLVDYLGHRATTLIGTIIMVTSLVLTAFTTQVWHLYLTQGLLYGAGLSLTFFASMPLPSQWFTKNRGLATGISASGAGIGGFWISPLVGSLLQHKGFMFTMLTLAIVHLVLLLPAGMLYRTRLVTGRQRAKRIKRLGHCEGESRGAERPRRKFVDLDILKDRRFCLLVVSGIFNASGYFSPFFFLSSYTTQHNVDKSTAALMIGLMNGSAAIGRVVMGFILDRIGSINALFISSFAASLTVLFLWMFAETSAMMFIFSVAYGFCAGAQVTSSTTVAAAIAGIERLASVTGIMFTAMGIGAALGPPISGALLDTIGRHTDFTGVILWTGMNILICSVLVLAIRVMTSRQVFIKV